MPPTEPFQRIPLGDRVFHGEEPLTDFAAGLHAEEQRKRGLCLPDGPYLLEGLHPKLFVWLTLKRFEQFWFGTWPSLLLRESAQLGVRVIVTAFALIGLILAIRDSAGYAFLFLAFLCVFPLVHYVTHIDPRYRHPIELMIVVLAVHAATTIANYVWRRLSGPGSGNSRLSEARTSPDSFRLSFL